MTDEDAILHPFATYTVFRSTIKSLGDSIFGKYRFKPDWSETALLDAYAFWVAEVNRCSREINATRITNTQTVQKPPSVPSQLKKAGALASALNRVKPIKGLQKALTYDHEEKSDFQVQVVEIYVNEFLAFEVPKNMLLVADEVRDGMANFADFLKATDLKENDIFSHELINDMCFFLRSRAPSATSLYMVFKGIYATSYAWRKKNHAVY